MQPGFTAFAGVAAGPARIRRPTGDKLVTECLARYGNYRRFRVETYEQVKP